MPKEQRTELMTAAATKLEEAAHLLSKAGEEVLADEVAELADIIAVAATPANENERQ